MSSRIRVVVISPDEALAALLVNTTRVAYTFTRQGYDPTPESEQALPAINEQLDLAVRHFDIADRIRNRLTGLVQVTPVSEIGLSASVARGRDDYKNSGFGQRDSETTSYTLALDL